MKIDPLALILFFVLWFMIWTWPTTAQQGTVVATCGGITLTAGRTSPLILDTTGRVCATS